MEACNRVGQRNLVAVQEMKYCKRCLYPESKPDLSFDDDGVCSACQNYDKREKIDWIEREKEFVDLVWQNKSKDYDCIVPVSGGKDSTYQVIKLKSLGLRPLAVTASTDSLTPLGRRNLDNIRLLGVDHIELSVNPVIRRKINRIALRTIGDISWPEHVLIFTIPVRIAVALNVKLIVWGECPQNEYGGPAAENKTLDRKWLEEFGGLLGMRVSDLCGQRGIGESDLTQYTYPEDVSGVTGIFLGHYFPWDGLNNFLAASAHGFECKPTPVEGSLACYENLDNYQTGIHDWFKWAKFGFGRATDIACNHIRRGRMTREVAIPLVEKHDGAFPWTCHGIPLSDTLTEIDMTEAEFFKVVRHFTNKKLFEFGKGPVPKPLFKLGG